MADPLTPSPGKRRQHFLYGHNWVSLSLLSFLWLALNIPVDGRPYLFSDRMMSMSGLKCVDAKGVNGVCMFKMDCVKHNGTLLATCLDGFLLGTCCQLSEKTLDPAPDATKSDLKDAIESHSPGDDASNDVIQPTRLPPKGRNTPTTRHPFPQLITWTSIGSLGTQSAPESPHKPSKGRPTRPITRPLINPFTDFKPTKSTLFNETTLTSTQSSLITRSSTFTEYVVLEKEKDRFEDENETDKEMPNTSRFPTLADELSVATSPAPPATDPPLTALTLGSTSSDLKSGTTRFPSHSWRPGPLPTTPSSEFTYSNDITTGTETTDADTISNMLPDNLLYAEEIDGSIDAETTTGLSSETTVTSTLKTVKVLPQFVDNVTVTESTLFDQMAVQTNKKTETTTNSAISSVSTVYVNVAVNATQKSVQSSTEKPSLKRKSTTGTPTRRPYINNIDCGIRPLRPRGRVVGGRNAYFGEWPWQVLIKEATWLGLFVKTKCGGVLIDHKWVLTAAHCQPGFMGSLLVVVGEYDLTGDFENLKPVAKPVKRMIVHRDYNPTTFENDIALLELESAFEVQPHVIPICLPDAEKNYVGLVAHVAGWGKLSYGGPVPSILQVVRLPILANGQCQQMFLNAGHVKTIRETFICAGYTDGGKDSCEGDSGGPLMVQNEGRWSLVGTVSHGIKCAEPNLPGVYMRTSAYRPWIDSILNKS